MFDLANKGHRDIVPVSSYLLRHTTLSFITSAFSTRSCIPNLVQLYTLSTRYRHDSGDERNIAGQNVLAVSAPYPLHV